MKVMFVVGSYWPSQDGVAHITGYLAEGLAERGHEVLIFTSAGDGGRQVLPHEEVHNGVLIRRMRVYVEWPVKLQGLDSDSTPKRYWNEIEGFAPDVLLVVCSQTWTLDWIKDRLNTLPCRKIFYSHGFSAMKNHYEYKEYFRRRNIVGVYKEYKIHSYYRKMAAIMSQFDSTIHITKSINSYIMCKQNGIPCDVLENAIENQFFEKSMRHNYKNHREGIRFLCIGNYNTNKNQMMIAEAFMGAKVEKSELWFAGFEENDYLTVLKNKTEEYHKNKIIYNVHLSREKIYNLYREADVFVCASISETWSIVAHESAAVGMPIISTPVGSIVNMPGVLIAENVEQMRNHMEYLYNNRNEIQIRGYRLREYIQEQNCTIRDKVDWLEREIERICI